MERGIGLFYSAMTGLWGFMGTAVFLNFFLYRRFMLPVHFYMLFNIFFKTLQCVFLAMSLLWSKEYFSLPACSTFVIFSTSEIGLIHMIAECHFINKDLPLKSVGYLLLLKTGAYFVYSIYLIVPQDFCYVLAGCILGFLLRSLNTASKNIQKLKKVLVAVRRVGSVEGVNLLRRYVRKISIIKFEFFYFIYSFIMVGGFGIAGGGFTAIWVILLITFEVICFITKFLYACAFRMSELDRLGGSFLADLNLGSQIQLLQAWDDLEINQEFNFAVVVTPGQRQIMLATLINESSIII